MTSLEAKGVQFKRYLEQCGVIEALTKALIKLYDEDEKPNDAIRFVRKHMCENCADDEQFNKIKSDHEEALRRINELEEELYRMKGNLKRTPSDIVNILESEFEQLKEDDKCESLLKKYLNDEIFNELSPPLKTPNDATLLDIIQSGLKNHDSSVGVYAADAESYEIFEKLLKPIIIDYHNIDESNLQKSNDWGDPQTIENLDPEGKYIISTRIRVARNLRGQPFFSVLSEKGLQQIERSCKNACLQLKDKLKGTYTSVADIDRQMYKEMTEKHIIFEKGNKYLEDAGAYRFWPTGRGLFRNKNETFIVWVNEEDHMRIMSMEKSGDLGAVYQRLIDGIEAIQNFLEFAYSESYGYLTSCPTNLGTTMRASVHIKLPKLSQDETKLNELIKELKLQIRGTHGEHTEIQSGIADISNKHRLGYTEYEIIENFQNGVKKLIEEEENL